MRADKYFAEKFGSRTKAAEAIEKGFVLVNGKPVKSKDEIKETDEIAFIQPKETFVSNGGYKLARALEVFGFDCRDKTFVDIGASTGGFTDCLLRNGAKKVFAVDVGESLLHESLSTDKRVVIMENTNARYLSKANFLEEIDGVVTDVSFISLRHIFPTIKSVLGETGEALVLIKPQFECENQNIGKSGIVRPTAHAKIVEKVLGYAKENGLYPFDITHAPIKKGKNIEYILRLSPRYTGAKTVEHIIKQVKDFVSKDENNTNGRKR